MLKTFSMTDIGRKRKINQDYVFTQEEIIGNLPNLFIVADGMGGRNAGDYASKSAVDSMVWEVQDSLEKNPQKILEKAIDRANQSIYKRSCEHVDYEGMGTTVVAAVFAGDHLQVANVGDSRLYVIDEEITQITRDHSLVEEMVRLGGITREEARNHPKKNVITRAVGVDDKVEPDFYEVEVFEGDLVLMCTDGLTNMLEDQEIFRIVKSTDDIQEMVEKLVFAANERGGKDNISVILVEKCADK